MLPVAYRQIAEVVGIISLGSLINVSTGVNSSIIYLSKKYKAGLLLLLMLFVVTIILNILLIPKFGLIGAAISNCTAAVVFNLSKYLFLYKRYGMQPFNRGIAYIFLLIVGCFFLNYLLPYLENPLIDILYRSVIIAALYIMITHRLKIIPETDELIKKYFKKS